MKKHILKGLLVAGLFLSSAQINKTYAQFDFENLSFGGNLGYTGWASLGSNLAFGVRGHYVSNEKLAVVVSYNTQIPVTSDTYDAYAQANSSLVTPSQVSVEVKDKVSFHQVAVEGNYYFVGDLEENFGLYGLAGVGLVFASVSSEVGDYDKSKYNLGSEYSETQAYTGLLMNGGIGANFMLSDQISIFGEAKIGIPANRVNEQAVVNPIPFNYGFGVGVRFNPFN